MLTVIVRGTVIVLLDGRTMSEYTIEITPQSKVVIFQGSLKKAPPLNKRGRKVRSAVLGLMFDDAY